MSWVKRRGEKPKISCFYLKTLFSQRFKPTERPRPISVPWVWALKPSSKGWRICHHQLSPDILASFGHCLCHLKIAVPHWPAVGGGGTVQEFKWHILSFFFLNFILFLNFTPVADSFWYLAKLKQMAYSQSKGICRMSVNLLSFSFLQDFFFFFE